MHSKTLKKIYSLYIYIDMNKGDLKEVRSKTLKEKIYSIYIYMDMNNRDLKKLTKAQLIRLLLKQQAQKPSNSVKQMVNEYENIIQPSEQFRDAYKPIPPPRIGKWKNVKPKPVKQMVKEYEDIIQPPEQFRDGCKPIPKPRADRPLQMRGNQNA